MAIELNKVNIEIDGKVYQFYKMSFGFQRRVIEMQKQIRAEVKSICKKHGVTQEEIDTSDKVTEEEKLHIAEMGLQLQEALAELFVNPDEATILSKFDQDTAEQLITALQ